MKDRAEQMREAAAQLVRDEIDLARFADQTTARVLAILYGNICALPLPPQPPLDAEVAGVVALLDKYEDDYQFGKLFGDAADLIERLARERDFLLTCGIIELAVRNPNVNSYVQEWEARAEKAEADLVAEREMHGETQAALRAFMDDLDATKAEVARLREALKDARDSLWFAERELRHAGCVPTEDCDLMADRIEMIDAALNPKGADHG